MEHKINNLKSIDITYPSELVLDILKKKAYY